MPSCYLLYKPVKNSVFHFMRCSQLKKDEENGWIKTYRFTDRTSGVFELFDGSTATLKPCSKCLAEWDDGKGWQNYNRVSEDREREAIISSFSIPEFFRHCNSQEQMPRELAELYQLMENNTVWFSANIDNKYPSNWREISLMYRTAKGFRCEICGVDLSAYPDLAVTHHVNGCHYDVSPDNMRVLCILCHSKQIYHEHTVKMTRYEYNMIRKLRSQQGKKMDDL